jgi:hypothetical protein
MRDDKLFQCCEVFQGLPRLGDHVEQPLQFCLVFSRLECDGKRLYAGLYAVKLVDKVACVKLCSQVVTNVVTVVDAARKLYQPCTCKQIMCELTASS